MSDHDLTTRVLLHVQIPKQLPDEDINMRVATHGSTDLQQTNERNPVGQKGVSGRCCNDSDKDLFPWAIRIANARAVLRR